MSDTPFPPNPFEGDPDETNPFGDEASGGSSDAFFGGVFDADDSFEPALDAASFADGADAYFEEAIEADILVEGAREGVRGGGLWRRRRGRGARGRPRRAAAPPPLAGSEEHQAGRSRGTQQLVLGINVTATHVHGVLLRDEGDDHYAALHTLTRTRSQGPEDTSGAMTPSDVGGIALDESFDDGSIQFGGGQELDFTGEFDGLAVPGEVGIDMGSIAQPRAAAQPIMFELKDMLEEIEQVGFDRPALAFSISPPDVEYAEILVPEDKKSKKAKQKAKKSDEVTTQAVKREKLVALMPPSQPGREIDTERVAFLPMTPREGRPRYLALIPQPTDPVVPALTMLREHSRHRRTTFKTIEAEVSLLMGLAGLACPAEPNENTAVVRVGAEDTLVLLLSGNQLHHMEPMQSVTAYDGPDTICSRVLLQQDVQGVGTVHNVVVLADEREDELVQGFSAFYPDARVAALSELLSDLGIVGTAPEAEGDGAASSSLASEGIEAAGAALAAMAHKGSPFQSANLLPKALRKKKARINLTFGWHTLVVAVLLFLSIVFFIGLYFSQASDIAERERTLAEYPPEATMAVPELQMRIDSLRQAQMEITNALAALDSLLYGTDRATQELVRTSRAASASGGIWFEDWAPGANTIGLHGYATSRARVVSLAQRLNGTIEEVTFQEVRGYPVYEWRLLVPSPIELPQTARYLREQLGEPVPPPRDALAGLDAAAPMMGPSAPRPPAPAPAPEASGDASDDS